MRPTRIALPSAHAERAADTFAARAVSNIPASRWPSTAPGAAGPEPLPGPLLRDLRTHTGHDFGHVRVHSDAGAASAAATFRAGAFTDGRDVWLGTPARGPSSLARWGLAHELGHVALRTRGEPRSVGVQCWSLPPTDTQRRLAEIDELLGRTDLEATRGAGGVVPVMSPAQAQAVRSALLEERERLVSGTKPAADVSTSVVPMTRAPAFPPRPRPMPFAPETMAELTRRFGDHTPFVPRTDFERRRAADSAMQKEWEPIYDTRGFKPGPMPIVGYRGHERGGMTEILHIDGSRADLLERPLEKPLLDPIDLIPWQLVGRLAATATRWLAAKVVGGVSRAAVRTGLPLLASVGRGIEESALQKPGALIRTTTSEVVTEVAGPTIEAKTVGKAPLRMKPPTVKVTPPLRAPRLTTAAPGGAKWGVGPAVAGAMAAPLVKMLTATVLRTGTSGQVRSVARPVRAGSAERSERTPTAWPTLWAGFDAVASHAFDTSRLLHQDLVHARNVAHELRDVLRQYEHLDWQMLSNVERTALVQDIVSTTLGVHAVPSYYAPRLEYRYGLASAGVTEWSARGIPSPLTPIESMPLGPKVSIAAGQNLGDTVSAALHESRHIYQTWQASIADEVRDGFGLGRSMHPLAEKWRANTPGLSGTFDDSKYYSQIKEMDAETWARAVMIELGEPGMLDRLIARTPPP